MSPDLDARFLGDEEYLKLKADAQAFLDTFKMLVLTESLRDRERTELEIEIRYRVTTLKFAVEDTNTTLEEIKEELAYALSELNVLMKEIFLWRIFNMTDQDTPYIPIPEHDVV